MATITAAAGGGLWNATATWTGAIVPTAADDVKLASTSGAVTINVASACRSLDCTGYVSTLTHTAAIGLTIGDATAGLGSIALKLVAGMTYTLGDVATSLLTFASTSATQQTIDYGGKNTGNVTFSGVGSSYLYSSGQTTAATATITLTAGTLNTNGLACSWGLFSSSNATVRTLTLGASAITVTGGAVAWNIATSTNMTLTASTSTITCNGANVTFNSGTLTYNSVSLTGAGSNTVLSGVTTYANFTRTGTAVKTDTLIISNNITVTGTLTLTGNSAINRLIVQGTPVGTAKTLTAATVSITNTDFMDITGAGVASPFTGTSLGDAGGNTGITFTTTATQTWAGTAGGNWSANAWTTRVPLPQDDVVINAAFAATQTVTPDMPRLGRSISWVGATGAPIWNFNSLATVNIFGSLTLISGMSMLTGNAIVFAGRSTFTMTSAGLTLLQNISLNAPNGTIGLVDALTLSGSNLNFITGTFNTNNFNVTCSSFNFGSTATRVMNCGTSTFTLTRNSAGVVWYIPITGLTFSGASATFVISGALTTTRTFDGQGQSYGTLTYTVAGSTGALSIAGANTFNTINFSDVTNARTLTLTAGTTTTVTNFNVNGTATKLMTVNSTTAGTTATLSKPSGIVSSNYLSLQDSTATGGAGWYAGTTSTSVSNVVGWILTAPPGGSRTGLLMMGIG